MKKFLLLLGIVSTLTMGAYQIIPEQVGIGSSKPDASASLHLTGVTKGFIPNKVTTAQRNAIPSPARGLIVYNTNLDELQLYNGAGWVTVGAGGAGGVDAWATATVYAVDDVVIYNQELYLCQVNHTSGVFATDLANGNWLIISDDVSSTGTITDTAIPRFVGTSGNVVDSSGVTIDASNNVAGAASLAIGGSLNASSILDTVSTTKGTRPCPSMSEIQRDAIGTPATGLCVYNTDTNTLNVYNGSAWVSAGGGISLWATGKSYKIDDVVIESDRIYRALTNHISGTFATDLAANRWTEVSGMQVVDLVTGVTGILPTANGGTGSSNLGSGVVKASSGTLSTGTVDLTSNVNGILPIANGGTGSSTQNFVDLTTNQTVAGEKTFSNTLKSDTIQTTGSSGVVIRNSSGTQVADFGPANTTNATIAGGLNVGVNIQATGTVTGSNLSGTNTGDLTSGGDNDTPATTATIVAPNKQLTLTGTNQYRLNTGNLNELENPSFEHSTVSTAWTISNATATGNTTNKIEGKKAISLALTGALSLSQSSTINAADKSGVQMVASIWVNSSDVSDLQLCSLKNGSEDKCTVAGGYVQGSGWRQLTVSFLGNSTSNGLKLKSTDTTGTVLVDQAYVGLGSPVVDFTPDMVYSAKISSAGTVTEENTDWISGNCTGNSPYTCTFNTGVFSVAPNCVATQNTANNSGFNGNIGISSLSAASLIVRIVENNNNSNISFILTCQKQGADYKTSKAYVASSSDYGWTLFTPTVTNLGTITPGDTCRKKKDGGDLLVECFFTNGTASSSLGSIDLPDSLSIDTTRIGVNNTTAASGKHVGVSLQNGNAGSYVAVVTATGTSTTKVYFAANISGAAALVPANANATHYNSQPTSISFRVPISGWQDSSVIVGSFQGYNETPGTSRVETFSVSYGTTNATTVCSASPCFIDQIGNAVTSVTRGSQGIYNVNFSKTYAKIKCTVNAASGIQNVTTGTNPTGTNANSIQIITAVFGGSGVADTYGTILCQGIPQ